jgi:hypothetical protein
MAAITGVHVHVLLAGSTARVYVGLERVPAHAAMQYLCIALSRTWLHVGTMQTCSAWRFPFSHHHKQPCLIAQQTYFVITQTAGCAGAAALFTVDVSAQTTHVLRMRLQGMR